MPVNAKHPLFDKFKPRWDVVNDVAAGPFIMSAKSADYLETIADIKTQDANGLRLAKERNDRYRRLARFSGFTGSTVSGFTGLAFNREPELSVHAQMNELIRNIDGSGVTLEQQAKRSTGEVLTTSRAALWVDYPLNTAELSAAQMAELYIRPVINRYDAEGAINWRTTTIGGVNMLSLVVIPESYVVEDDGFTTKTSTQYRTLQLISRVYHVIVYRQNERGEWHEVPELSGVPTDGYGNQWEYIPFTFIGAVNNDSEPDEPMMEEIAHLNIGHYRNSADLEISSYDMRPTVAVSMSQNWFENVVKGTINMGGVIPLEVGCTVSMVQASPNDLAFKLKDDKKSDMIALCARIIEPQKTQRTATEAVSDSIQYTSRLSSVADNISAAYTFALNCCARYMGLPEDCIYKLNTNYNTNAMTAQERQQLITEWLQGAISDYDYWRNLTAQGVVTDSFEDWQVAMEVGRNANNVNQ